MNATNRIESHNPTTDATQANLPLPGQDPQNTLSSREWDRAYYAEMTGVPVESVTDADVVSFFGA